MAQTETKTVRVKLKCSEGKSFTKSISSVNPDLLAEGGKDIAQAVVDTIIETQPFDREIEECTGVDVVERSVNKIL